MMFVKPFGIIVAATVFTAVLPVGAEDVNKFKPFLDRVYSRCHCIKTDKRLPVHFLRLLTGVVAVEMVASMMSHPTLELQKNNGGDFQLKGEGLYGITVNRWFKLQDTFDGTRDGNPIKVRFWQSDTQLKETQFVEGNEDATKIVNSFHFQPDKLAVKFGSVVGYWVNCVYKEKC